MTKKYLLSSIVSILIIMIGISLAYFQARITGEGKNITLNSKYLKIVFTDSEALTVSNIEPGWNTTKTFTVKNESESTYSYNLVIKDLVNTFRSYGALQYKIESTNSGYTTNNEWKDVPKADNTTTPLAFNISIPVDVTQSYTLYLRYQNNGEDLTEDLGKTFTGKIEVEEGSARPTLVERLLAVNPTRATRTSFDSAFTTTNTKKLYTTTNTEDGSTVYYFAGNALNNWVKFGKCTSASYNCQVGEDLYWRIIRTNETIEDGGLRLLYAGSGSVANQNAYIGTGCYSNNCLYNDPMYVGYMYGTSGSLANNRTNQVNKSTAASTIESWYTATFNNNSDNKTKDTSGNLLTTYINPSAIYCNDRSVSSYFTYNTGSTTFYYGALTRLYVNKAPSYACGATIEGYGHYFEGSANIADKFTGNQTNSQSVTIGNGLLSTTTAALITADEISFAGGVYGSDSTSWYYYNAADTPESITGTRPWWTMSSHDWDGSYHSTGIFNVYGSAYLGKLSNYSVNVSNVSFRPVISLKSNIMWVMGDGSPNSPFEVELAS